MVMPSSLDDIKNSIDYCDAFLIGINGYSVNMSYYVDIEFLDEVINYTKDKELFISLNKNMFNDDLVYLKDIMIKLNDYNISGVFYYDVGVFNIYNEISHNYDLVWASEHATTNYNTINYWNKFGVNYSLISSDITRDEIIDIRKNTNVLMIVPFFGYMPMFNSLRHIVKNYLNYFKLDDKSLINYMEKEGMIYPIIDDKMGTSVYTDYILNGFCVYDDLLNNNIDYILFNSFNIESDKFLDVLKCVDDKKIDRYKYVDSLFLNTSVGFLFKETIAKVKKDEK